MRANSPGAFFWSTTLHAGVAVLVLVITFWLHRATEIRPLDFDLVDLEQLEFGPTTELPGPPDKAPSVGFTRPKVKPMQLPKPEKVAPPKPEKPTKDTKAPAKDTKPSKKKTTSYEDFQKQNQKQLQANQKVRSTPRKISAPGIDAKSIVGDLMKSASGNNSTKATIAALDAYFARLVSALRAAHEMPDSVSDLLVARVSFYLAADGSISRVRIVKTSGNSEYDESVVDAFARVRSIGAVPGGTSGTREINFKMTE